MEKARDGFSLEEDLPLSNNHIEISNLLTKLCFYPKTLMRLHVDRVYTVKNDWMLSQYNMKMREIAATSSKPRRVFVAVDSFEVAQDLVCKDGLKIGHTKETLLAMPSMGVCVQRFPDVLSPDTPEFGKKAWLVIFKVVVHRCTAVKEELLTARVPPPGEFDCLESANFTSVFESRMSLTSIDPDRHRQIYNATQFYIYEYNSRGKPIVYPQNLCPLYVVEYTVKHGRRIRDPQVDGNLITKWLNALYCLDGQGKMRYLGLTQLSSADPAIERRSFACPQKLEINKFASWEEVGTSWLLGMEAITVNVESRWENASKDFFFNYLKITGRKQSEEAALSLLQVQLNKTHKAGLINLNRTREIMVILTDCDLTRKLGIPQLARGAVAFHCILRTCYSLHAYSSDIKNELIRYKILWDLYNTELVKANNKCGEQPLESPPHEFATTRDRKSQEEFERQVMSIFLELPTADEHLLDLDLLDSEFSMHRDKMTALAHASQPEDETDVPPSMPTSCESEADPWHSAVSEWVQQAEMEGRHGQDSSQSSPREEAEMNATNWQEEMMSLERMGYPTNSPTSSILSAMSPQSESLLQITSSSPRSPLCLVTSKQCSSMSVLPGQSSVLPMMPTPARSPTSRSTPKNSGLSKQNPPSELGTCDMDISLGSDHEDNDAIVAAQAEIASRESLTYLARAPVLVPPFHQLGVVALPYPVLGSQSNFGQSILGEYNWPTGDIYQQAPFYPAGVGGVCYPPPQDWVSSAIHLSQHVPGVVPYGWPPFVDSSMPRLLDPGTPCLDEQNMTHRSNQRHDHSNDESTASEVCPIAELTLPANEIGTPSIPPSPMSNDDLNSLPTLLVQTAESDAVAVEGALVPIQKTGVIVEERPSTSNDSDLCGALLDQLSGSTVAAPPTEFLSNSICEPLGETDVTSIRDIKIWAANHRHEIFTPYVERESRFSGQSESKLADPKAVPFLNPLTSDTVKKIEFASQNRHLYLTSTPFGYSSDSSVRRIDQQHDHLSDDAVSAPVLGQGSGAKRKSSHGSDTEAINSDDDVEVLKRVQCRQSADATVGSRDNRRIVEDGATPEEGEILIKSDDDQVHRKKHRHRINQRSGSKEAHCTKSHKKKRLHRSNQSSIDRHRSSRAYSEDEDSVQDERIWFEEHDDNVDVGKADFKIHQNKHGRRQYRPNTSSALVMDKRSEVASIPISLIQKGSPTIEPDVHAKKRKRHLSDRHTPKRRSHISSVGACEPDKRCLSPDEVTTELNGVDTAHPKTPCKKHGQPRTTSPISPLSNLVTGGEDSRHTFPEKSPQTDERGTVESFVEEFWPVSPIGQQLELDQKLVGKQKARKWQARIWRARRYAGTLVQLPGANTPSILLPTDEISSPDHLTPMMESVSKEKSLDGIHPSSVPLCSEVSDQSMRQLAMLPGANTPSIQLPANYDDISSPDRLTPMTESVSKEKSQCGIRPSPSVPLCPGVSDQSMGKPQVLVRQLMQECEMISSPDRFCSPVITENESPSVPQGNRSPASRVAESRALHLNTISSLDRDTFVISVNEDVPLPLTETILSPESDMSGSPPERRLESGDWKESVDSQSIRNQCAKDGSVKCRTAASLVEHRLTEAVSSPHVESESAMSLVTMISLDTEAAVPTALEKKTETLAANDAIKNVAVCATTADERDPEEEMTDPPESTIATGVTGEIDVDEVVETTNVSMQMDVSEVVEECSVPNTISCHVSLENSPTTEVISTKVIGATVLRDGLIPSTPDNVLPQIKAEIDVAPCTRVAAEDPLPSSELHRVKVEVNAYDHQDEDSSECRLLTVVSPKDGETSDHVHKLIDLEMEPELLVPESVSPIPDRLIHVSIDSSATSVEPPSKSSAQVKMENELVRQRSDGAGEQMQETGIIDDCIPDSIDEPNPSTLSGTTPHDRIRDELPMGGNLVTDDFSASWMSVINPAKIIGRLLKKITKLGNNELVAQRENSSHDVQLLFNQTFANFQDMAEGCERLYRQHYSEKSFSNDP